MNLVKFKNITLPTLVAISEKEQAKGLMGVSWPPPIMTFLYSSPKVCTFWMKNTNVHLDILFCLNNEIHTIISGNPNSVEKLSSNKECDFVIELPGGFVKLLDIKEGDPATFLSTTAPPGP